MFAAIKKYNAGWPSKPEFSRVLKPMQVCKKLSSLGMISNLKIMPVFKFLDVPRPLCSVWLHQVCVFVLLDGINNQSLLRVLCRKGSIIVWKEAYWVFAFKSKNTFEILNKEGLQYISHSNPSQKYWCTLMIYFWLLHLFAFIFKTHCYLGNTNISQNLAYSPSKVHPLKEIHTGSHESTFPFFPHCLWRKK